DGRNTIVAWDHLPSPTAIRTEHHSRRGSVEARQALRSQEDQRQTEDKCDDTSPFHQAGEDEHRTLNRPGLLRLTGNAAQGWVPDKPNPDADPDNRQTHTDPATQARPFRAESR